MGKTYRKGWSNGTIFDGDCLESWSANKKKYSHKKNVKKTKVVVKKDRTDTIKVKVLDKELVLDDQFLLFVDWLNTLEYKTLKSLIASNWKDNYCSVLRPASTNIEDEPYYLYPVLGYQIPTKLVSKYEGILHKRWFFSVGAVYHSIENTKIKLIESRIIDEYLGEDPEIPFAYNDKRKWEHEDTKRYLNKKYKAYDYELEDDYNEEYDS